MDIKELQQRVKWSHDKHFNVTELRERLRDINNEVTEMVQHRDAQNLLEEIGDAGWSLLQLCNEVGFGFDSAVLNTVKKLDSRAQGKKVALIGTSANPITNAHLTMALEILALTEVDEVWLYLVGVHPWGKKMLPAEHRLEMARRAVAKYPRIRVCDFEMVHADKLKPGMETAHVLHQFFIPAHKEYQFSWVMGSDVAQTFEKWTGADWMASKLNFWVIHRLGYDWDQAASILSDTRRHTYLRDNIVTSNISSSLVRERGKAYEHDKLMALVPEVVWDYLVEHRLLDPEKLG